MAAHAGVTHRSSTAVHVSTEATMTLHPLKSTACMGFTALAVSTMAALTYCASLSGAGAAVPGRTTTQKAIENAYVTAGTPGKTRVTATATAVNWGAPEFTDNFNGTTLGKSWSIYNTPHAKP